MESVYSYEALGILEFKQIYLVLDQTQGKDQIHRHILSSQLKKKSRLSIAQCLTCFIIGYLEINYISRAPFRSLAFSLYLRTADSELSY